MLFRSLCEDGRGFLVSLFGRQLVDSGLKVGRPQLLVGLIFNFVAVIYVGLRTTFGIIETMIEFNKMTIIGYLAFYFLYSFQGYIMGRTKQELIIEKYSAEESFKYWKDVLDIIKNPIIICGSKELIYCNNDLVRIIEGNNTKIEDIIVKVFLILYYSWTNYY